MTIPIITMANKEKLNKFLINSIEACDHMTVANLLKHGADNRVEGLACANSILMSYDDGARDGLAKTLSETQIKDLKRIIHLLKEDILIIKSGEKK